MPASASFDYARLVAAFGIVLFHAQAPGASIGYAALPFFLILMLHLGSPQATHAAFAPYARKRIRRLLWPWLIWSGVYATLKLAEVALTRTTLTEEFALHMLLTGPALHLWFLPFACLACLCLPALHSLCRMTSGHGMSGALLIAALAAQGLRQGVDLPVPLAQWINILPAALLGLAFVCGVSTARRVLALSGVFGAVSLLAGWTYGLPQIALATGALALCTLIHVPQTRLSGLAAHSALGVYLIHPLIFSILQRTTPLVDASLAFAACAALGAWVLTLIWKRFGSAPFAVTH